MTGINPAIICHWLTIRPSVDHQTIGQAGETKAKED